MREWTPELVVGEALARRLIGERFPEVATDSLVLLAEGWDNAVWIAGEWAFRFPQRELGVRGLERELTVLPRLAPLLPLPIPVPLLHGRPTDGYPWPFFGFRLVPGREAALAGLDDAARLRVARPLGTFLRALHDRGAEHVADLEIPIDPMGRADPERRLPRLRASLGELTRLGLVQSPKRFEPLLDEAAALPPPGPHTLVHGDLHARHVLVAADGMPTGVIDWGDLCLADPSVDLSIAWGLLPEEARAAFEDEYGEIDAARRVRARMLAAHLCAVLAVYARAEGIPELERESLAGLQRAAEG